MDRNIELLNSVYQNASMASQSIDSLMPKVEDPQFVTSLKHQQYMYNGFVEHASRLLSDYNSQPQETPMLERAALWSGVQLNSLFDSSPSHIAEMMIQGSTMGVTDINKKLKEYFGCDKPVDNLGKELMQYEQSAIEELKTFL